MAGTDRRAAVIESSEFNGIDFVEIADGTQTVLRVHFLNAVDLRTQPMGGSPTITGGETITTVKVAPIQPSDWGWDDGHAVLTLRVAAPGDFSIYTLTILSPVLDQFFNHIRFSFKAGCPSDLDCETPPPPCPPLAGNAPPIDYMAKDFLSFRQSLLDFSALRYPSWQERSEADFGVMFLEALSAIADELSYTQDRVAIESSLLTATQRRSVIRHARLVDYEPRPARSAKTVLQFDVDPSAGPTIKHGLAVIAPAADGTPITFETGLGLDDTTPEPAASPLWNRAARIQPYPFDDSERCLPVGATQMNLRGQRFGFQLGQALLIETATATSADPPLRQIVRLVEVDEICDPLFLTSVNAGGPPIMTCPTSPPTDPAPSAVTRITWSSDDALTDARDLLATIVIGNIANATQGRTVLGEAFMIGPPPPGSTIPSATERTGPRPLLAPGSCGTPPVIRLYSLANAPLAWLPQPTLDPSGAPIPEIRLTQTLPAGQGPDTVPWSWFRRLLGAGPFDTGFTIDPALYSPIARVTGGEIHTDYDGDAGDTIRFGDSVFGANPDLGSQFLASYRFGAGAAGNVAIGAITQLDPATIAAGYRSVMNPQPATGGADAQTIQSIQRLAPQAFRATQFRAVLATDYAAAAENQPWVKRAGTVFRWTGSWLTTFTTPEPVATEQIAIDDRVSLVDLLNRYRMAGTESYVPDPQYVSIDLTIELCAMADAFAVGVKAGVTAALSPTGPNAAKAYFAVSRFVFGQPLERSTLEAAIQAVPGVAGVTCIHYRLRDRAGGFREMTDSVPVGVSQIIRCDDNPSRPNNGSLTIIVRGGR
jgi:hypothetical protein